MSAALQNVRTGGTKRGTELVRFDALRPRRRPSDRASGPSRIGYVPALDGMRGVAVLLVMAFHARAPFLPGGFMGVDVFFVLSGFLITCLLLAEREQKGHIDLKNFYMRRALRLLPAVVAFLGVYVLSVLILCREVRDYLLDALIVLFYAATNSFTVLKSANAGGNTGTMTFSVINNTLSLVCGTANISINDFTLASAGGAGIFAWGPNGTIDNFSLSGS